ncbi:MAG: hypothetical protein HKN17_07395, partial [Rhodothermales bacterium]|nr:hypothetical protein [Rhodothermales bacterium]
MKTYDENDIGRILRRASALSTSDDSDAGLGLTLDELHTIGRASGIEPSDIDRAVAELEAAPGRSSIRWWGGPLQHTKNLVVDGEMSDDDWEDLLVSIRDTFQDPGTVQIRGSTYEWTGGTSGQTKNSVSCSVRDGRTRVRVFWINEHQGLPAFIPVLVGSLIAIPILAEETALGWGSLPIWMAIVSVLFLISRTGVARYNRKKRANVDRLAAHIERRIGENRAVASAEHERVTGGRSGESGEL